MLIGVGGTIIHGGRPPFSPRSLFYNGEKGTWYDPSDFSTLFQDSAGTTAVLAVGQPVGKMLDKSGNGYHATQATSTSRPILARHPITGRRNLLVNTDALSTQSYTTLAVAYTLSFTGTGTVTLSGAYTGSLVGTGASNRVSLTFTSTAASLTLTVSGSVTFGQLELGSVVTNYQTVTTTYDVTEAGVSSVYFLKFDGVDDFMVTPSINFTATDKMSLFVGGGHNSNASTGMLIELSADTNGNSGSFYFDMPESTAGAFGLIRNFGTAAGYLSGSHIPPARYVSSATIDNSGTTLGTEISNYRLNQVDARLSTVGIYAHTAGTFGNYPIYIGMRGGVSLPFNGHLYSLVVRGALSDATQIANAEAFVNGKTGAY